MNKSRNALLIWYGIESIESPFTTDEYHIKYRMKQLEREKK